MRRAITWSISIYIIVALVTTAYFSPPTLSFVPILLVAAFIFLRRFPINFVSRAFFEQFIFFTIAILMASTLETWLSLVIALPILLIVTASLAEAEMYIPFSKSSRRWQPTRVLTGLTTTTILTICIAAFLGSLVAILAGGIFVLYLGILVIMVLLKMPVKPVQDNQINQRIIAGTKRSITTNLNVTTKIGGSLSIESPHPWLTVDTGPLSLKNNKITFSFSLTPSLSGPTSIELDGYARDRWGLLQSHFQISPINLLVIPRARYAEWFVKRYLAGTGTGTLPLISNIAAVGPTYGLREGIEYYGNKLYQPGDSFKTIDWKHSVKYNELVSKEFADLHGQPALVLINLVAGSAEEADILAYNIVSTAVSLVAENIPAFYKCYDQKDTRLTTNILRDEQILNTSLKIAQEITTIKHPERYLNPPDVRRLRANMSSMRHIKGKTADILYNIMNLEYQNLHKNARANPLTKGLIEGLGRSGPEVNVVVISRQNHDAEALSFNVFSAVPKGQSIIVV